MSPDQQNQTIEQPQMHHCGDPECTQELASQRVRSAEERWDNGLGGKLDAKIEAITERSEEIFSTIKKKIEPYSIERTSKQIDDQLNRFDDWLIKRREIAEQYNTAHPKQPIQIPGRKIVAAVTTASALIAPAANTAPVIANEAESAAKVAPKPAFDPQLSITIKENIENDPALKDKVLPTVDTENGNKLKLEMLVEPESKETSPRENSKTPLNTEETPTNSHIIDLQGVDSELKTVLARTLNVPIGEQQRVTINNPKVGYLEPGQTPFEFVKENLLHGDDKENLKAQYALTHVMMEMNGINIDEKEDRLIKPTDPLLLPQETPTIFTEQNIENSAEDTAPSDTEAAYEELVELVEDIEDPNPEYDMIISASPKPTPVTDALTAMKDENIEDIEAGKANIEAIQSEAIKQLSEHKPELSKSAVAEQMAANVFAKTAVAASEEMIEEVANQIVKGALSQNEHVALVQEEEGLKLDNSSKSITEIADEIEKEVNDKLSALQVATERVEQLGIESPKNLEELAQNLVSMERSGGLTGDELYYSLIDGKKIEEKVDFIRNTLAPSIYATHHAESLLANTDEQIEIINMSADVLSQDFVSVDAFIVQIEERIFSTVEKGKTVVVPVIAEIGNFFEEVDTIDEDKLVQLAIEASEGVSTDYIRMSLLEDVAHIKEKPLNTLVSEYLTTAFNNAGLAEAIGPEQITGITSLAMVYWQDGFEKRDVQLDAEAVIEDVLDSALKELILDNEIYLENIDAASIDQSKVRELLIDFLIGERDESYLSIHFINEVNNLDAATDFLYQYYDSKDAGYYIHEDNIVPVLAARILADHALSPEQFIDKIGGYSGNPEEILPEGRQYILRNYEKTDLTEFLEKAGISNEVLSHPLNDHIERNDEGTFAVNPTIWFEDADSFDEAATKQIYDELVLGIRPPQPVELPTDPELEPKTAPEPEAEVITKPAEPNVEAEQNKEKTTPPASVTERIEQSLDRVEIEDSVNNLDRTVEAATSWYQGMNNDPHRPAETPDGYIRMPFADDLQDFDLLYTRSEKAAPVETYAAPETVAVALGMAELWHQLIETKYPEYAGSMLRFRDFNSAHHKTHGDGRNIDVSTQLDASITEASTGPAMDFVSGDGTQNNYNFELNVDYAVAVASLKIDGKYAIRSILTSDSKLVKAVNDRLGRKVMYDYPYHSEHWHVSTHKDFALENFKPVSPFEELGYKGDLGIGGEYQDVPEDMREEEHGDVEEALIEASEDKVGSLRKEKEDKNNDEQEIQEKIAPKSKPELDQKKVSEARSVDELVKLGYTSLDKLSDKDKKMFNDVLAQMPTIEYAIENYNSLQGDPRGPKIPATAVLAIGYDLGMRGDDLLDTVTTIRGESVGFSPYVIGDDKGVRKDGEVVRFSTGLGQFYQYEEDGFTEKQMDWAENLLHPVAAMIEVQEYKEKRGLSPWNFWNNRESGDHWEAHRAYVLEAAEDIDDAGVDVLP